LAVMKPFNFLMTNSVITTVVEVTKNINDTAVIMPMSEL